MEDAFEVNLDPRLPESSEARRQALRLIAARLESAATERPDAYVAEFDAAVEAIDGAGSEDEKLLLALRVIDACAAYAWALFTLLKIEEMSENLPEYVEWLRHQDESSLLAQIERSVEALTAGESTATDDDAS